MTGPRTAGIVLAGGRSSRFGRDKLAEPFDGRPLLDHAVEAITTALAAPDVPAEIVLVVAPDGRRDLPAGVRVVRDPIAFDGPLAGLATGLRALDATVELVVLVAGDMPRLVPAVLRQLLAALESRPATELVLLEDDADPSEADLRRPPRPGRPFPAALRRAPALAASEALLRDGERRLVALGDRLIVSIIPTASWTALDPAGRSVRDIDVPADLALIEAPSGTDAIRAATLAAIADGVVGLRPGHRVAVAVDGVDGAGKTTFADELAALIRDRRPVLRATEDRFHRPAAARYARGRDAPEGFYRDSYDDEALRGRLLEPFAAGGAVVTGVFDHRLDLPAVDAPVDPPADAVLLIDGLFLHRPALVDAWDASILLEVGEAVAVRRNAERDGSDPDPEAASNRRYVEGQRLYLAEVHPERLATWVVDNDELATARVTRGPRG